MYPYGNNVPFHESTFPKIEELLKGPSHVQQILSSSEEALTEAQTQAINGILNRVFIKEKCGLIKAKQIAADAAIQVPIKCRELGCLVLHRELTAFKESRITYEQFKDRNGQEAVSLLSEMQKESFKKRVIAILKETHPGLIQAMRRFGDTFCSEIGLTDHMIASSVIPAEVKALETGTIQYSDFVKRNGYYVFDFMTEREISIAKRISLGTENRTSQDPDLGSDCDILFD